MTLEEFKEKFPEQIDYLYLVAEEYDLGRECAESLRRMIKYSHGFDHHSARHFVYDVLYEWRI